MKWIVIDTIIQPSCGISFSAIWGNMKMIIWYQSTIFLPWICPYISRHLLSLNPL
ncbi:hypothetical protein MZH74_20305, partial [Escherichia coli]|nr:hypothetical protein [Escherichia coli]